MSRDRAAEAVKARNLSVRLIERTERMKGSALVVSRRSPRERPRIEEEVLGS
jgi:hypothetical protein